MSHVFIDHFFSWNEALKHEKNLVRFFKVISFSFDIGRGKNWLICLVLLADNIKLVRCWQIFDKVQYKRHVFIIKNRWSYSGISSLIHPFYLFFFSFSQEGINATRIFLEDAKKLPPGGNDRNILVATHELESFAIKYGKIHLTAKESAVIVQELFGEFCALFDESVLFYFFSFLQCSQVVRMAVINKSILTG